MDLNYLFHRQQVSMMMSAAARSVEARLAHAQRASRYATQIAKARKGATRLAVAA